MNFPAVWKFPALFQRNTERFLLVKFILFLFFFSFFFSSKTNEHLNRREVTFVMENSKTHACFTAVPLQNNNPKEKTQTARLTDHHIKALGCILIYPMHAAIYSRISE